MKCANCQMLNNTPETPCTHCGRMLPALKPIIITKGKDDAEGESSGVSTEEAQTQEKVEGQEAEKVNAGQTQETHQTPPETETEPPAETETSVEEVGGLNPNPVAGDQPIDDAAESSLNLEKGRVDNVGDESESETIT